MNREQKTAQSDAMQKRSPQAVANGSCAAAAAQA